MNLPSILGVLPKMQPAVWLFLLWAVERGSLGTGWWKIIKVQLESVSH